MIHHTRPQPTHRLRSGFASVVRDACYNDHHTILPDILLQRGTPVVLIEEHWIHGELWNWLAHVRLTDTTLTFSAILMRWALVQIPVTTIREVQLQKHIINDEVIISYFNERGAFKTLSFSTNQSAGWGTAFQRIGVHVTRLT